MSSEIQFGDLEQSEPQRALRPDQDAHFSTALVGSVGDDELLIFVDLDVQRDMEAHALSNTRVELGGVILGHQYIDDQGRPFVVISDSLRAEHYEATKGSFKFTHETWSQITRQREQFRPDLEMVGWYHTHPGWSVFLSGMDLFICNNFFNRPLDVALVIDPCEQDRGWFQWTQGTNPTTRRTNGFVLTTGRFRKLELDQFACVYNKEPPMNIDPRYSGNSLTGVQPAVTLMDNRKPVFELAVIGMLILQFLLFAVVAWKMLGADPAQTKTDDQNRIAQLESELERITSEQGRTMREDAYREVLTTLVATQTGDANLVDEYANLKEDRTRMLANLEGQMALVEKLQFEQKSALVQVDRKTKEATGLQTQLALTQAKLDEAVVKYKTLAEQASEPEEETGEPTSSFAGNLNLPWWWLAIGSIVVGLFGSALGYAFRRNDDPGKQLGEYSKVPQDDERFGRRDTAREDQPDRSVEGHNNDLVTIAGDGSVESKKLAESSKIAESIKSEQKT